MPELAEVAYASSLWKKGLRQRVVQVLTKYLVDIMIIITHTFTL